MQQQMEALMCERTGGIVDDPTEDSKPGKEEELGTE